MAAKSEFAAGRSLDPPGERPTRRAVQSPVRLGVIVAVAVAVLWFFPLFHVVPLRPGNGVNGATPSEMSGAQVAGAFDAAAFAEKFWREKLAAAAKRAPDASMVLTALRRDPAAAAKQHANHVGIGGTAYYFVRGTGRVASSDKSRIVVVIDGADGATVALRVGPLFGNALRDGTGLLNVNEFPGLQEFNEISAELNRLAETQGQTASRERASVGAAVSFAGCAEAPESVGSGPLLTLVPVYMEFR